MRYLINPSVDPHYNMAFDQFCIERLPVDEPVFYLWRNRPSVIVGLSQNVYSEVNLAYLEDKGIVLARRMTGGGAVYHDLQNLNYSMVGRSGDFDRDCPGYMHLMTDALRQLGVPAELTGRNDILVDGMKVSGYAKRVWHDRLMVHGTLMFDVDLETLNRVLSIPGSKMQASGVASVRRKVTNLKEYLPQFKTVEELQTALQALLSNQGKDEVYRLSEDELRQIEDLKNERFATWQWNYGRSPVASCVRSRKFACGTVEIVLSINHGIIEQLAFGGDFIGNLPAEDLARALQGCRYDRESVGEVLTQQDVSRYFDRLRPEALLDLLFEGDPDTGTGNDLASE